MWNMPFFVFLFFVGIVLGLSFYLGRRARSAKGFYAAHGTIPWFVNGIAFAGDYLSAASFLGICGLIALYGYDGFLYSIGYLAGWIVALFVIAEPIKRLGRFTFADALDARFNSRGIKLTAAISTLVVSIFYLIPQMVGAGALVKPLLNLPHWSGVLIVGVTVIVIVVTAGMVSTTWVQFIKGSLLVVFCFVLVVMILNRGLKSDPRALGGQVLGIRTGYAAHNIVQSGETLVPPSGGWIGKPYARIRTADGHVLVFRERRWPKVNVPATFPPTEWLPTQTLTIAGSAQAVNGLPEDDTNQLKPIGGLILPNGESNTGPVGPFKYLATLEQSKIVSTGKEVIKEADGSETTVYYPIEERSGSSLLTPGGYFKGLKSEKTTDRLDFISLMIALFCGTASLPHILIRYYTVKDQASARKSTVVGIAAIGFFYILTLYLGLAAMTSGVMDPTDTGGNMAAPLLAKSFNPFLFAVISAIAFTTVLGTVSGLIMAASGAVAHDLMTNFFGIGMDDQQKVRAGKITSIAVGGVAMLLGIVCEQFNVSVLVGWAFAIAASANLPALVMLLFWKGTTKQGIAASVAVGMVSSLAWVLLAPDTYTKVYKVNVIAHPPLVPFSQPGIITIPLAFAVLVAVSFFTRKASEARGFEVVEASAK